ncbi:MAG: hypothetical protein WCS01_16155, partial [bacterium]
AMQKLQVELCPESGLCSIVRGGGTKTDLMPDEVSALREAGNDLAKVRAVVAGVDDGFGAALTEDELRQLARSVG